MNIEQYPLLQYIIKKHTYIYNSELRANNFCHYWLLFLIDLYYVCHSRLCEGTVESPIFIRKVYDCSHMHGYWCSRRCWYIYMTFERNDGIWISDINPDRIPQLCARYWDSCLSHCCSSIIYLYIRAVSSYSLWYLVSEVKVNLFTFESAEAYTDFYT